MDRREQAIEQLRQSGAVFGSAGDVDYLKRLILLETKPPGWTEVHNPKNQCRGKLRHLTEESARRACKFHSNPAVQPYLCPHCAGWHIGRERKCKW